MNYIEATILSVAEEIWKTKDGNEKTMYRLYIAANDGNVGYVYSVNPHLAGNIVKLGLGVKDGKLRLKLMK